MAVTLLFNSSALKVTDAFLWNQSVGVSQRGKKCRKTPNTKKPSCQVQTALKWSNNPGRQRNMLKAKNWEKKKLFQCLSIEVLCKSPVFPTTAWSFRAGLALSMCGFDSIYWKWCPSKTGFSPAQHHNSSCGKNYRAQALLSTCWD